MSASQPGHNRRSTPAWILWSLAVVTLVAAFLRLWQLDQLPPGLFFDEAYNGLDARAVADGERFPLYFAGNNGREPLYLYLQAVAVKLLGPSAYALRLTSALIGILTVPLVFVCARRLLLSNDEQNKLSAQRYWPLLIATAGLAISYWHVSLSRLAFRAVLLPPLSLLAVAFFWRAWTTGGRRDYIWSGVWFGLALYSYIAARILPLVIVTFVLIELIIDVAARPADFGARWRSRLGGLGWLIGAGLLVCLPLLVAFVQDPALVAARTGDVSIFSAGQTEMPGTPGERFLTNAGAIARSFYDQGDLNVRHNLPARPVQDWLLAALFTVGWLYAFWQLRTARMRLILLWFGIMALPSLLSTSAPHALRMAGMLPPLALLYGVGAAGLLQLTTRWLQPQVVGVTLFMAVLLFGGISTTRDYFNRWAAEPTLGRAFDLDQQLAAQTLAEQLRADEASVLTTRRLFLTPHVRFALGSAGTTELEDGAPTSVEMILEEDPDPFQPLYLLTSSADGLQAAWLAYEETDGALANASAADALAELTWPGHQPAWPALQGGELPMAVALRSATPRYPLDVTFANGLRLVGYDVLPDGVSAGADEAFFRLATYWRLPSGQRPSTDSFDLFAHLLLADGAQVQENGNLGRGYPVDLWLADQVVDDRRSFSVPIGAAPGKARFEIGLYDPSVPDGAERIAVVDDSGAAVDDRVLLGAVAIDFAPPQAPVDDLTRLDVRFDERIGLAGWSAHAAADDPTMLVVDLAWESLDRVTSDYTAFVHLLDPDGTIVAQFDQPPGGADNPTAGWLPGGRTRTEFPLAGGAPAGPGHSLRIGLYEPVSGRQLPASGSDAEPGATYVLLPLEVQP